MCVCEWLAVTLADSNLAKCLAHWVITCSGAHLPKFFFQGKFEEYHRVLTKSFCFGDTKLPNKESQEAPNQLSLTLPESEHWLLLPEGSAEENKPLHITVRLPS